MQFNIHILVYENVFKTNKNNPGINLESKIHPTTTMSNRIVSKTLQLKCYILQDNIIVI